MHKLTLSSALAVLLMTKAVVAADIFPSKPIRFIVTFAPGGAADVVMRVVAHKLNEQFKRQVTVVENRPGAGGVVGSEFVARSAPDGYTLVLGTTGTHAINASLYTNPSYDPVKDFAPITPVALLPNMIVVHPSVPVRNIREMVALAKAKPGELSYASTGNFIYLTAALFENMAGVRMLHVPFKGGGQAMPALLSGEVSSSFATIVVSMPLVSSGKLRGLAVTSAKRFPTIPQFPTVAESGLPNYEATAWYGLFAPAGTPNDIVSKLNAEIVRIGNSPEVRDLFLKQGAEAYTTSPEEFGNVVKRDVVKWAKVVKASGAKPE